MARKVEWTETAWNDLEAVSEYIAKDSRYYASAFVREVRDAARSLTDLAERGRIVPELGDESIRELFVRRYRLIYKVRDRSVSVIAFIHGARDMRALWDRENR